MSNAPLSFAHSACRRAPGSLASFEYSLLAPFLQTLEGPGPGRYSAVSLAGIAEVSARLGLSPSGAMIWCLEKGVWPLRFKANRGIFTESDQVRLLEARILVIGCGGLGGYVCQLLARMGVGKLRLCDHDVFEESNLNRQLFCTEDRIGKSKALSVKEELARFASHSEVEAFQEAASPHTLPRMLEGVDVLVDCLDDIPARRDCERAAQKAGVAFVHGSLAGTEGFAFLQIPGCPSVTLDHLYGSANGAQSQGAEARLGVPATTATLVATLQVWLAVQALLSKGHPPSASLPLFHLDLSVPEIERLFV